MKKKAKVFKKNVEEYYMKTMILILIMSSKVLAQDAEILDLAQKNGFKPSNRVVKAISYASKAFDLNPLELSAIALLETGMGKYNSVRLNKNGTTDQGIFQINSVNKQYCLEYDISTPEGSALCAAKLLSRIKHKHFKDPEYLGRYHSKTPKYKKIYFSKLTKVLAQKGE